MAAKRLSVEELRDDVRRAGVDPDVVDREDVGVIQLSGGARLLLESPYAACVHSERFGHHLERNVAREPRIPRAVYLAHTAGAQPADDFVRSNRGANRNGHVDEEPGKSLEIP